MLAVEHYSVIPYESALKRQHELVDAVIAGSISGAIMTLQHAPCLTLGRHADRKFLLESHQSLIKAGITLIDTDRGGEITAHNPGQLVIYPILPIKDFSLSPKKLVQLLLESVVEYLADLGINASIDDSRPGVWLQNAKICAVGIRILKRVSMHGIALNIENDLSIFSKIVPCGISSGSVTRMKDHCTPCPPLQQVRQNLIDRIAAKLGTSCEIRSIPKD